jgi:hypothetical protein
MYRALDVIIGGHKRYLPLPRYTVNVNMDRMETDPASDAFQLYESLLQIKEETNPSY